MSLPEKPTLSWLLMERYVLGELSDAERRTWSSASRVPRPIGTASCRSNRTRVSRPNCPQFRPKSRPPRQHGAWMLLARERRRLVEVGWGWLVAGGAAVVGLAFVSLKDTPTVGSRRTEAGSDHTKGGEIALELVNERASARPRGWPRRRASRYS